MSGKVFIVTGPSGVGKSHIIRNVLAAMNNLVIVPTYTTRAPRQDDIKNQNRICVSKEEFQKLIENNELLEYKVFNDNFYGKRRADFEKEFKAGNNVLLDIDTQGLNDYKKEFGKNLISIFISYENLESMKYRIKISRPDATEDDIESRYKIAQLEMRKKDDYDYCITNYDGKPKIAIEEMMTIIKKYL